MGANKVVQKSKEAKMKAAMAGGRSRKKKWSKGPVQNTPLAVCDPNTVSVDDIVPQDLYGFAPKGQHNMGIKFNPEQKWYYYPDMTVDEVLVFRQFQYENGWEEPYKKINTVFHTAFQHPNA